jgi:hypothetical protein
MDNFIDNTFDFYSDTPLGKDPDSYSLPLRTITESYGVSLYPMG